MRDPAPLRKALGEVVTLIRARAVETPARRATWARCRPSPGIFGRSIAHPLAGLWTDPQIGGHLPTLLEATQARDGSIQYTPNADDVPVIDSETWIPELSSNGFVGIFHHHHVVWLQMCCWHPTAVP